MDFGNKNDLNKKDALNQHSQNNNANNLVFKITDTKKSAPNNYQVTINHQSINIVTQRITDSIENPLQAKAFRILEKLKSHLNQNFFEGLQRGRDSEKSNIDQVFDEGQIMSTICDLEN